MRFSVEIASSLAELPIQGICREYPHRLDHVVNGPADLRSPRELHPAFYGCFDWHSAVHGHWMLVYLLKRFNLPAAPRIRGLLNSNLTRENLQAEANYLSEPGRQAFERPYGWAWLLKLAQELHGWDDEDGSRWSEFLRPLETLITIRGFEFLERQRYPVRVGVHANTAFTLSLGRDYAAAVENSKLLGLIDARAIDYFGSDTAYCGGQEPSGADFLSPCLCEADLLRRVLPSAEFRRWFHAFLPEIQTDSAPALLHPVEVSVSSDEQLGHLAGLNLSRAWCLASIASALAQDDAARKRLEDAAQHHAVKGLSHVATGDYTREHWLGTFAVYMLSTFESIEPVRVE